MRPKSGLPKRKAIRSNPAFEYGFRENPLLQGTHNPDLYNQPLPHATKTVSLFSGCGGLDLGILGGFTFMKQYYEPLPFEIVAAYDNDAKAVETYRLNISGNASVRDLAATDVGDLPTADLLLGGFPCQDFSSCGHKRGFESARGNLYRVMVDYMEHHRPALVLGENVPLLAGMKNGFFLATIVADLESVGYRVEVWRINCPDFGLPQSRKRVIIVAVRNDIKFQPITPMTSHFSNHVAIDDALDDLINVSDESVTNQSQFFVATKATAGAGQGDHKSKRGEVGYAVRANAKARVHFHYELDRRLTIRECARLQSFPDEFIFPFSASTNLMQIGNAVPPIIGHHLGKSIASFFSKYQLHLEAASI